MLLVAIHLSVGHLGANKRVCLEKLATASQGKNGVDGSHGMRIRQSLILSLRSFSSESRIRPERDSGDRTPMTRITTDGTPRTRTDPLTLARLREKGDGCTVTIRNDYRTQLELDGTPRDR